MRADYIMTMVIHYDAVMVHDYSRPIVYNVLD